MRSIDQVDERVRKTQHRLRQAALKLAASQSIESVSVTRLCNEAKVDRATFYRHASSPVEVLMSALIEDLDKLRTEFLVGVGEQQLALQELWTQITKETIEHVKRFDTIYRAGFTSPSVSSLENLFRQHVQKSMQELFESNPALIPAPREERAFLYQAISASLASSLTAIMRSWVNSEARNEQAYLDAVLLSLPYWMRSSISSKNVKGEPPRPKADEGNK